MKTLIKALGIVAALALLFYAGVAPKLTAQNANTAVVDAQKPDLVLHVKGLACENCARSMKSALLKLKAVVEVEVFLEEDQRAHLQLLDGETVSEEALRQAVEGSGFVLERVEFKNDTSAEA